MFGAILRREILSHIRSLRFTASFILCFIMMIASIHLLAERQAEQPEPMESDGRAYVTSWRAGSLSRLSRWGPVISRRAPTLRVLCTGIGNKMALEAGASAQDQPEYSQNEPFLNNPMYKLFPAIDFCLIVGIVASLIAIVFTYDLVVGEKENGTLRLILANSVPRHYILSAKWLGSFLSFLAGYVPGLLIVLLYMELHPGISLDMADYASILVIYLLSILYAACFFSLGLFVSCRCSDSRTSLLILLMLWTLLTLVIPSFSAYLGAALRPTPPPYGIEKQVRLAQREANIVATEKLISYAKQHAAQVQAGSEQFQTYQNQIFAEEIRSSYRNVSSIRDAYTEKLRQQIQLSQTISCISPFSSFVYLASDLCHTGIFSNWHFRRSVESYQGRFIGYIDERLKTDKLGYQPKLDTLPEFSYYEKDIPEIIQLNWFHFVFLVLYSIIFFLLAYLSFLKYDVR